MHYRSSKIIALLLAMLMIFVSASAFAEGAGGEIQLTVTVQDTCDLSDFNPVYSVTTGEEQVKIGPDMDPNLPYTVRISFSSSSGDPITGKEIVYTLPEEMKNLQVVSAMNAAGASCKYEDGSLSFSWDGEPQSELAVSFSVTPAFPTEHDISGTYAIQSEHNKSFLKPEKHTNNKYEKLQGYGYQVYGGAILTDTTPPQWNFRHVSGNWYTVSSDGKYLHITSSGLELGGSNAVYVRELGGGSIMLTSAADDSASMLNVKSTKVNDGFITTTPASVNDEARVKLYQSGNRDLSGTYAIITEATGAAVIAEKKSDETNKLASVKYIQLEDGVTSTEREISLWSFSRVRDDWYTVSSNGKYLKINNGSLELTDRSVELYVQQQNGKVRITDGAGVALNNYGNNPAKGYIGYKTGNYQAKNEWHTLAGRSASDGTFLVLNVNGGTVTEAPKAIAAKAGEKVTLPDLEGTKNGEVFIGWADTNNLNSKVTGTNHTYHEVYKPGTAYRLKGGTNTLYAVYNSAMKAVRFCIRADGVIQDEPNGYDTKYYKGHFTVDGILKEGRWIIDIDATKPVNDYYMQNNITANLNWIPSAEQIAEALKNDGNIDFNPESQYIHWYVLKNTSNRAEPWHVDGVIRNKTQVSVTYNMNVPEAEKTLVKDMPGGYQVAPGTDILIGADEGSTMIKKPARSGYIFMGWNTQIDGSGTYYDVNRYVHLTSNLNLYAQWVSVDSRELNVRITSDWPMGKMGYVGEKITLTAELFGFDGLEYTLYWQYSTDGENWTDVPDAHDITYTFILDEVTTNYHWRAVAREIR